MHRVGLSVYVLAAGDVSIWDFSGVESYYGTYDKFLGDPNAIYMVVVSLKDSITERRRQVDFWLNFITTRMVPVEPIGKFLTAFFYCSRRTILTAGEMENTAINQSINQSINLFESGENQ